jgi:hypothetical protein
VGVRWRCCPQLYSICCSMTCSGIRSSGFVEPCCALLCHAVTILTIQRIVCCCKMCGCDP